jgi:hypothetical protein
MIVEKDFPRRNRNLGCRDPNPRVSVPLIKDTLANIAAIVALALMSGTVKADQATKTTAQLASISLTSALKAFSRTNLILQRSIMN